MVYYALLYLKMFTIDAKMLNGDLIRINTNDTDVKKIKQEVAEVIKQDVSTISIYNPEIDERISSGPLSDDVQYMVFVNPYQEIEDRIHRICEHHSGTDIEEIKTDLKKMRKLYKSDPTSDKLNKLLAIYEDCIGEFHDFVLQSFDAGTPVSPCQCMREYIYSQAERYNKMWDIEDRNGSVLEDTANECERWNTYADQCLHL